MRLYGHYLIQSPDSEPEYLDGDFDFFQQGVRDWAREQRDLFISAANEKARSNAEPSPDNKDWEDWEDCKD